MKRVTASMRRKSLRAALLCGAVSVFSAVGTAWADTPECGSVLTDTSRPVDAWRDLARQCLAAACTQEAQELQLEPDATARFMAMCLVDESEQVSGGEPAGSAVAAPVRSLEIACTAGQPCSDPGEALEATAAGVMTGGRASSGHTFVRVPRINEVIER
jgi:hypothetical protein